MRKATARKLAQTMPSPPPEAISPMVSMLMTAATMKKTMSARPSVRRNRVCCSAASAVCSLDPTSGIRDLRELRWGTDLLRPGGRRRRGVDRPALAADSTELLSIEEVADLDAQDQLPRYMRRQHHRLVTVIRRPGEGR